MHDNFDDDKREQVKESDKIRKKEMCDNLDDNEKGELKMLIAGGKKKNVTTLILMKRNC